MNNWKALVMGMSGIGLVATGQLSAADQPRTLDADQIHEQARIMAQEEAYQDRQDRDNRDAESEVQLRQREQARLRLQKRLNRRDDDSGFGGGATDRWSGGRFGLGYEARSAGGWGSATGGGSSGSGGSGKGRR